MFVATLGYSRRLHVRAFRSERQESWFAGLESAFTTFGGVPEEVLMDNPRALVVRHDAASRSVSSTTSSSRSPRHWGFRPRACAPYRARTKGKTESGVGYVKKNAIAGHCFASWEAFEAHLAKWEREVANVRMHGTTGEAPIARFERDEAHRLKPLGGRPSFGSLRELDPRRRQRLRDRDRHQQLLGAVAADRRARGGDGRGRRGAHPAWRARGRRPQAIGRPAAAHRRSRPPRRCCRCYGALSVKAGSAADGRRRRQRPRCCVRLPSTRPRSEGLLMARAKETAEVPTDPLDAMLARLKLSGIRDQLDSLLDEAARANLSARETLLMLCEREIWRGPATAAAA